MFIINKKRLIFIELSLIFSILFASLYIENNTILTASTPVTGHSIILDAGHGLPDGGAENNNGLTEEKINLDIVLKLQKLLEASNCTVILTRSDENGIYSADAKTLREKKVSDMKNRVNIAKELEADIFVSIHLNKIAQSKYFGWQTFYKKSSECGKMLSLSIQNNLNSSIQIENKRQPQTISGKYIIDNIKIPTVIVECGFLSNPTEANLLEKDSYQEKIAWGIYTGIIDFFSNNF